LKNFTAFNTQIRKKPSQQRAGYIASGIRFRDNPAKGAGHNETKEKT
jgi:hypothetical protein